MLALLIFLLLLGFGLFIAREKLSPSYFRRFFAMPWGRLIPALPFLEMILTANAKLEKIASQGKKPDDLNKIAPAHLALIHSRDRLTRPLASALIDMALRDIITIKWRSDSEDFLLVKNTKDDEQPITKADRALLAKLFPNEATELPLDWGHSDLLGAGRRLLEKAYAPKSMAYALGLGIPMGPILLGCLLVAIGVMVGSSDVGFVSLILPILVVLWPNLLFWSMAQANRARIIQRETGYDRFQARFFIYLAVTAGIVVSAIIMLMVMLFAFGIIRTALMVALGALVAVTLSWLRPAKTMAKPHAVAAAFTYNLINKKQSE